MQRNILVDLLRIILLAWIVLFHYTVRYNDIYADTLPFPVTFENGGTVGVALFFVMSGFFMAPSLLRSDKRGPRTFASYCARRFLRFWPLYIICCVAIVGVQFFLPHDPRHCTPIQLVQNLLIFPVWKGTRHVDGAHWFLETLLLIQFICALALLAPRGKRLHVLMVIIGINALCSLLFAATDIKVFDRIAKIIGGRHYIWCVFIGMVLCLLFERGQRGGIPRRPLVAAGILAGALWIAVGAKLGSIWFAVYTALFICAIMWRPQIPARIATFVSAAAGVMLAWYLVHQNIGYGIIRALANGGTDLWLVIAAACAATFALALLCSRLERPASRLVASLAKRLGAKGNPS